MYRSLARQGTVWLYFVAIFAYLGCEQGTSDWISRFLSRSPRLRSAHLGRAGCLLVLGLADGRLFHWHVSAQAVGLPPGINWGFGRRGSIAERGAVRAGEACDHWAAADRIVCFGNVADRVLVGAEFGKGLSRFFCRNSEHGYCGGRDRAAHHWTDRRSVWIARRPDVFVCYVRHRRQCGLLGKTLSQQCDAWCEDARKLPSSPEMLWEVGLSRPDFPCVRRNGFAGQEDATGLALSRGGGRLSITSSVSR